MAKYKKITPSSVLLLIFLASFFAFPLVNADTVDIEKGNNYEQHAKVNLNKASAQELNKMLKGIGQSKAEAIVAYRAEHGDFKSLDDLLKVKGIGKKTLENNRERLGL